MTRDSITLYLTEAGADRNAMGHLEGKPRGYDGYAWEVIPATMRDRDGTVDHGFKVSIKKEGYHAYFL